MSPSRVRMVDFEAHHAPIRAEMEAAVSRVLASDRFILGTEVQCLERSVADYLEVEYAVGVSSGTDALVVALMALGVGPSDEVITTPFSFVATAEAIVRVGARPRFVDVEPSTLNLDAALVEKAISPRTKAILAVHLYGRTAPLEATREVARRHGVALLEDAAQAFGARSRGGFSGTLGSFGCFSFFPSKVLGAVGDAGLLVTRSDALAHRARQLRDHGSAGSGEYSEIGGNFRMDAIQAAVLGVKLPRLERIIRARRSNGEAYDQGFRDVRGLALLDRGRDSEWNGAVYTLRVLEGRRDELRAWLDARGIDSAIYYAKPLHRQKAFEHACQSLALPVAERAAVEVLSLPVHAELTDDQRARVIDAVREVLR